MRLFPALVVFVCLATCSLSAPAARYGVREEEEEEGEEEVGVGAEEDNAPELEAVPARDGDAAARAGDRDREREAPPRRSLFARHKTTTKSQAVEADSRKTGLCEDIEGPNKVYVKRHKSDSYEEDALNEPSEESETYHTRKGKDDINRRIVSHKEGELLFDPNEEQPDNINKVSKNEYNTDSADASEQSRYIKQYYNTMHSDNKESPSDKSHEDARYSYRDRREVSAGSQPQVTEVTIQENDKSDVSNENQEIAIRNHVKKLSSEEYNELFNSLSEDKKSLLKTIMETDTENIDINKREITKKAGALEGLMDSGPSDKLGVASSASNTEAPCETSSADNADTPKPSESPNENTDNSEKNVESSSFNEYTNEVLKDEQAKLAPNAGTHASEIGEAENSQAKESKTSNKRQANYDDLTELDVSLDDLKSDLEDEESKERDYSHSQLEEAAPRKREVAAEEANSLEDSFPKNYDEASDAELVRVKRTEAMGLGATANELGDDAAIGADNDGVLAGGGAGEDTLMVSGAGAGGGSNAYRETDAFGPAPRSPTGPLPRRKRVRRVKEDNGNA